MAFGVENEGGGVSGSGLALNCYSTEPLLDLFLPRAMRRVPHLLLAVALTHSDLRRFDLLLHKLMGADPGGAVSRSYDNFSLGSEVCPGNQQENSPALKARRHLLSLG